jgi:hypothetical protein
MSQNQGPGTQNNPYGIPQEGHGGKNSRGSGGSPQNTNTKGNGAQKRKSEKKR